MAEETTPTETVEEQATEQAEPTVEPVEPDQPTEPEEEQGKGSKDAVLADLAKERDRRQAEQTARAADAEKFEAERTEWQSERDQLTRELALYRNADGANITALLDSKSFTEKLVALEDFSDEAVKALITETVDANPAFASTPASSNWSNHSALSTSAVNTPAL